MISDYTYYQDRPEVKPIVDCLDILTGLCGIVPVELAIRVMNEWFSPDATLGQVYGLVAENERQFEPDFGMWEHSGVEYFTHGSLTAASCNVAEFYRSKHQFYVFDVETGDYVGEYGPPNYERAQAERLEFLAYLASAHKSVEPPTDLGEYLGKGVEDALFEKPVTQKLHRVARAKSRNKTVSFTAEQAIRRNIRNIVGCDGTPDVWVPLLVDGIVAGTPLELRNKLDIPKIEQLTSKMFRTFPKWENNGWSDEHVAEE